MQRLGQRRDAGRLTCTATGTTPSSHKVRINQCNGSTNGGGALVICSANITNRRVSGTTTTAPTAPPTDVLTTTDTATPGSRIAVVALSLVAGFTSLVFISRSRRQGETDQASVVTRIGRRTAQSHPQTPPDPFAPRMLKATPRVSSGQRTNGGVGPNLRAFTSVGVRSLILITITLVLILIVLPAALVAAGS